MYIKRALKYNIWLDLIYFPNPFRSHIVVVAYPSNIWAEAAFAPGRLAFCHRAPFWNMTSANKNVILKDQQLKDKKPKSFQEFTDNVRQWRYNIP